MIEHGGMDWMCMSIEAVQLLRHIFHLVRVYGGMFKMAVAC